MTTHIEVAELGSKGEALIDDLAQNGGEICLTRDGKTIAKLVRVDNVAPAEGLVLYKGEWMSPAGAERERSIEHLRGSAKILGDIVSPIDDGPLAGSVTYEGDIISPTDEESVPETDSAPVEGRVLYNGRWMIPAAAERERSIEHLRESGKIMGDIVSPIDDGPLAGSVIDEGDIVSPIEEV
jgi:antitoxin (DNA-binding transcriptional repressor) of toxin-antitoxin stability system